MSRDEITEIAQRACEQLALVKHALLTLEREDDSDLASGAKWTVEHVCESLEPLLTLTDAQFGKSEKGKA
jgi:hypothetical protein